MELRKDRVNELVEKMWHFHAMEISNQGYSHQEILVAWDAVSFATLIKATKELPENRNLLETIRSILGDE